MRGELAAGNNKYINKQIIKVFIYLFCNARGGKLNSLDQEPVGEHPWAAARPFPGLSPFFSLFSFSFLPTRVFTSPVHTVPTIPLLFLASVLFKHLFLPLSVNPSTSLIPFSLEVAS